MAQEAHSGTSADEARLEPTASKVIRRFRSFRYSLVVEGIVVGVLAGMVTVLFRLALEQADTILYHILDFGKQNRWFIPIWLVVLAAVSLLVTLLLKWEPLISGSGIPQVEGEMQGRIKQCWWRVLLAKFVGGLLTIGSGLSLGREGPSIQLGAMAGKGVARLSHRNRTEEKLLITCGASAGLSAAFNAPFAGVLFSLEEIHKTFSVEVLLSTMTASITADFISRNVFGLRPIFSFQIQQMMPLHTYGLVILFGILLGLLGVLYNYCIGWSQKLYDRIKWRWVRGLMPFMLAGMIGFIFPKILGGGHALVGEINTGQITVYMLLILLAAKFLFSMISFGSGVPGGIFLPLLVLGAISGAAFSGGATLLFGTDRSLLQNFVILGMAGLFSAIVRAPITGTILICEMTGSFSHLLTLSLVSLTAYIVADLLKSKPVYDALLRRLLASRPRQKTDPTGEKILVETSIVHGAAAEGCRVGKVCWPQACLVISILRGEDELVPNGETIICAGDRITVLCDESVAPDVHEVLEKECRRVTKPM